MRAFLLFCLGLFLLGAPHTAGARTRKGYTAKYPIKGHRNKTDSSPKHKDSNYAAHGWY